MRNGRVLLAAVLLWPAPAAAQQRDRTVIRWPSARFPTLQAAIDAAPEGATLRIGAGRFLLTQPVLVRRNITIRGAGSGRRAGRPVTHLAGPRPRPVVDERGNFVLPATAVRGLFQVTAASVEIDRLRLSGFDAGIAATDTRTRVSLRVSDVSISNTGRGVLSLAPGDVRITRSRIQGTLWHGVSVAPPPGQPSSSLWLSSNEILQSFSVGALFTNTNAFLLDQTVDGNHCGGLVGIHTTGAAIIGSTLTHNGHVGILLEEPQGFSSISDNDVLDTTDALPCLWPGLGVSTGDGIGIISAQAPVNPVWVVDNTVHASARSGLGNFGSLVALGGKAFSCNLFDLEGEPSVSGPFQFVNLDPDIVGCGCPAPTGECVAQSTGIAPPAPVTDP